MSVWDNVQTWLDGTLSGLTLNGYKVSVRDVFVITIVSGFLSLFFYILFSKYRHWILIDLGAHKWLIK